MRRRTAILIALVVGAFFAAFFVWPLYQTIRGGFVYEGRVTLQFVLEVFRNPLYLEGLLNSLTIAVATTLLVVLMTVPLALLSDRYDFRGKAMVSALLLVPMILPPFVGAIGFRQIVGQYGSFNALLTWLGLLAEDQTIDWMGKARFWGVVLLEALHLYPIMYLNATAALANVDPAMLEASENLGCVGWRRFRKITLPLIMPGLFAGGTIVFIWSFTELGTPLMFDYMRVTPVQVFEGINEIGDSPFPYALTVVMLVASVLLYLIGRGIFGRKSYAMMAKATVARPARRLRGTPGLLILLPFIAVIGLAVVPHAGVILNSISGGWYRTVLPSAFTLHHYREALSHDLTMTSIANSIEYASLAMIIDILLGIAIAFVVVRSDLPGRGLLDIIAMLPLAVPGLVLAFGYLAMTQQGQLFQFLDPREDPTVLLVIAYAVRRLPYVVRSIAAGLQQSSVALEEAALNLGSPPLRTVRKIVLPLIAANVLAGGLLAFSFAMLEVSDSLMLAQRAMHYPITKAIFELFNLLGEGRFIASALGVWAMALLTVTLVSTSLLLGKRLGALFRV
ncbi:MAG: iron ABC transporter permease [Phycisphaerae bacterium]|nr:iron ABC transporter permease [Phycisphaerae bacterium]